MTKNEHFWKTKSLNQMTKAEWESLCDGCGKCCLHKLEDIDTGEISISNVSCSFLDETSCRCKDYNNRQENVADCIQLDLKNLKTLLYLLIRANYFMEISIVMSTLFIIMPILM